MMSLLRRVRAFITKILFPKSGYWLATKSIKPLSTKFGYDRGKPIDRYWIENFLTVNKAAIHGRVLEIVDNTYTRTFGHDVHTSDVLDLDLKNKQANIKGNLKNVPHIKDNTYDCVILTQVLGMIDDYDSALSECYRILKPDGTLLVTVSCFSSLRSGLEYNFWRFTPASANYVMKKHFKNVKVTSYGNVLSGQSFWVGLAQEELTKEELDYNDPYYPCVLGIACKK
jgi:SAM-dependent methyltransferase